jgi:hypothetical protein
MKAKVKKIKVGTDVEDEGVADVFVAGMAEEIGKIINVKRFSAYKNWYIRGNYLYHKSWLTFIKEEKK